VPNTEEERSYCLDLTGEKAWVEECKSAEHCAAGQVCVYGRCAASDRICSGENPVECGPEETCISGYIPTKGYCVTDKAVMEMYDTEIECDSNEDCNEGEICSEWYSDPHLCLKAGEACHTSADCSEWNVTCQPSIGVVTCRDDWDCMSKMDALKCGNEQGIWLCKEGCTPGVDCLICVDHACELLEEGKCKPGTPQPGDADGDNVPDAADRCPNTPLGTPVDAYGCMRTQKTAYLFVSYVGTEALGMNKVPGLSWLLHIWSKRALKKKIQWQREHFQSLGYKIITMKATAENLREALEDDGTEAIAWFGHGTQGQLQGRDGNFIGVTEMKKWATMKELGLTEAEYHEIENKAKTLVNNPGSIHEDELEEYKEALELYRQFGTAHFNLKYGYIHTCHSLNGTSIPDTIMARNGFYQGFEGPSRTTHTIRPYTRK